MQQLDYVHAVAPVLIQFNSVNGLDIVYGIQPDTFDAVSGGFVVRKAPTFRTRTTFWSMTCMPRAKKVKVGQTLAHTRA